MATASAPRLVLFPGMGADGRMYDGLRRRIGPITVPPWLPALPSETIEHYAKRYADAGLVRNGDVVGGSSFGGMVALAIAAHVHAKAVVLMGSCRAPTALPTLALTFAPLARLVPARAFSSPAAMWALSFKFGISRSQQRQLFIAMADAVDPRHLRWACTAMGTWRSTGLSSCPVHQIHGKRDRIIPASNSGAQAFISDAGHVPALTHPDTVAVWLRSILTPLGPVELRTPA